MLTRITTQGLGNENGNEQTALNSIYSLFPTTRSIIKEGGRECIEFTKLAIVVLNQKIRPFTARWHKISQEQGFKASEIPKKFSEELKDLQKILCVYSAMLADMAGVEVLTELEDDS